jgi:hypothetical protein
MEALAKLLRLFASAIVTDQKFKIRERLGQDGLNRLFEVSSAIECCSDDRYGRHMQNTFPENLFAALCTCGAILVAPHRRTYRFIW